MRSVHAEWRRMVGLRSTGWLAVLAVVGNAVLCYVELRLAHGQAGRGDLARWVTGRPGGLALSVMTVAGALVGAESFGSAYRHGLPATVHLARPGRLAALPAKALVVTGWTVLCAALAALAGVGALRLAGGDWPTELWRSGSQPRLWGAYLGLSVAAALAGLCVAAIVRGTLVAVAVVLALPLLAEPALRHLIGHQHSGYLPFGSLWRQMTGAPAQALTAGQLSVPLPAAVLLGIVAVLFLGALGALAARRH